MSKYLVVCEYGYDCTSKVCGFRTPTEGGTMYKALCNHIGKRVDVIEYQEVPTCDPNYIFKRKKNGF